MFQAHLRVAPSQVSGGHKSTRLGRNCCSVSLLVSIIFQRRIVVLSTKFPASTIRLSEEEMKIMNKTSVALKDGTGYLGYLETFHMLHCVVCGL